MLDAMTEGPCPLLTARDLLRRGSGSKHDELWDGALCVRAPSGGFAEVVAMRVARALFRYLAESGAGEDAAGWITGSSQGFLVRRAPDRVLSPGVAFTAWPASRRCPLGATPVRS